MADRSPARIVLHIGTHKTGSTSLQHFLRDHRDDLLASVGAAYPPGFLLPTLHSELPLLTVRPERTWPARLRLPETQRPAWLAAAEADVRRLVRSATSEVLVLSHEDLSYLRFDDEIARLQALLAGPAVDVVVFLREPTAFLRSYCEQLTAMEFALSDDPSSFAYVEPDSWLTDYEALLAVYRHGFGPDHVHVLDYDAAMARDGSVIPAFTDLLGIPRPSLPPLDRYALNRTGANLRPSEEQLAAIRRRIIEQAP